MARPLRIEFSDAIYHVTARGIERRDIALDDYDRNKWVSLLADTAATYRWRVFAFALMNNHFHQFLQTPEANLSAGMHHLNGSYAGFFNARHRRAGHLFQGRFKAILVEEEAHWLELSRYIHLNPVRAKLVDRPEDWSWSTYKAYCHPGERWEWMDYGRVLAEYGGDTPSARRSYRTYVKEGMRRKLESPLVALVHGAILGSERFVEKVRRLVAGRPPNREVPVLSQLQKRPDVQEVIGAVAEHFGCDRSRWMAGRRSDDLARAVAAYIARRVTASPARDIAESLGYRNVSSVAVARKRVQRAMQNRSLAGAIEALIRGF